MYSKSPICDYYAVIFVSQRSADDPSGYAAMAERIEQLARAQPGFVGVDSVRNAEGEGITVSYWESMAAVSAWRDQLDHRVAQIKGKEMWYDSFDLRIAKVERHVRFEK